MCVLCTEAARRSSAFFSPTDYYSFRYVSCLLADLGGRRERERNANQIIEEWCCLTLKSRSRNTYAQPSPSPSFSDTSILL